MTIVVAPATSKILPSMLTSKSVAAVTSEPLARVCTPEMVCEAPAATAMAPPEAMVRVPEIGEISERALSMTLLNSALRSEAVNVSAAIQVLTREIAMTKPSFC